MKTNTLYAVAAIALFGIAAPASADQICNPAAGPAGFCVTTYQQDAAPDFGILDGVVGFGSAVTTGGPVPDIDPITGLQKTDPITGEPLFVSQGLANAFPTTEAYGNNATALGNGARVGKFVPEVVAVPASCDIGAVNGAGDGCDDPAAVFTPAVEHVPAHTIPANDGTALGARAVVEHEHSTAVGADAATDRANQVVLGTSDDEVTVRNLANPASVDKSTRSVVVHQADGTLASDGGQIYDTLDSHGSRLNQHDTAIASLQASDTRLNGRIDEAFEGVAMSLAMESPQVDPGKTFGVALNWGNFEGENAFAAAARIRFDDTWSGTGGLGYGTGSNTVGVRAGIQAQW